MRACSSNAEIPVHNPPIDEFCQTSAREGDGSGRGSAIGSPVTHLGVSECPPHLEVADIALKRLIIEEWELAMSTQSLSDEVCAVCARCTPVSKILYVAARKLNLHLLCNESLPHNVIPTTYNFDVYERALLHPRGLLNTQAKGDVRVCQECDRDLRKSERVPKFSLANWLYYGIENLPANVGKAFATATRSEKVLVSRARASRIAFKFSELPDHKPKISDHVTSQRCVKGNVAIHPQDSARLSDVLPPSDDVIRDSLCAVFVSSDTKLTRQNIEAWRPEPILVRKSHVRDIVAFLVERNPNYAVTGTFRGFSQQNLDRLFGIDKIAADEGVPCAMEIGCLESNDAVEAATSGYIPVRAPLHAADGDDLFIDSVGYFSSDMTAVDLQDMKMRAMRHCLGGGRFVQSRTASRYVADFDEPALLSWLFPHLDPWGIGGFFDPRCERALSLEDQLRYLLNLSDSRFRDDPDFAFVYYNIHRKKAVYDSVTFRVNSRQREDIVNKLLNLDVSKLDDLIRKFKADPQYRPDGDDERSVLRLLSRVSAVTHDLPGTNGYKISLRNQIRSLITYNGSPTLFVTLNPSDVDHPLVRLYVGHNIQLEDIARGEDMSAWQRSLLVSRHPGACARFFDTMMKNFISIILRYGKDGRGLFG
ncbi:hypothetical protein C8Q76DRAFT_617753, partial [Earliella scabrosa]